MRGFWGIERDKASFPCCCGKDVNVKGACLFFSRVFLGSRIAPYLNLPVTTFNDTEDLHTKTFPVPLPC